MSIEDDLRVKSIHHMLIEMARGNFFYRLEPSQNKDQLTALSIILNMVSEEIATSFIHQGFTNKQSVPLHILHMSIIMDKIGVIEMVNNGTSKVLNRKLENIIGHSLKDFLTPASQKKWLRRLKKFPLKNREESLLRLEFFTPEGLLIDNECSIFTFQELKSAEIKILLDAIFFSKKESLEKKQIKNSKKITQEITEYKPRMSYEDIRIIQKVHNMILENLEKDLPKLKDLALQVGTNEYKLKYGFKEQYGTTIFRFLSHKRLQRAKSLIQNSTLSLSEIAHRTGFKSIAHFSRAFKNEYGISPSEMKR